jgi:hypothetical protein
MPSIVGGRGTRFCFPLMKMIVVFFFRSHFARFSAAVSLRFIRASQADKDKLCFEENHHHEEVRCAHSSEHGIRTWVIACSLQ